MISCLGNGLGRLGYVNLSFLKLKNHWGDCTSIDLDVDPIIFLLSMG